MSAEILRRAASLMRERAEAATEGPWTTWADPKPGIDKAAVETAWTRGDPEDGGSLVTDWCDLPDAEHQGVSRGPEVEDVLVDRVVLLPAEQGRRLEQRLCTGHGQAVAVGVVGRLRNVVVEAGVTLRHWAPPSRSRTRRFRLLRRG